MLRRKKYANAIFYCLLFLWLIITIFVLKGEKNQIAKQIKSIENDISKISGQKTENQVLETNYEKRIKKTISNQSRFTKSDSLSNEKNDNLPQIANPIWLKNTEDKPKSNLESFEQKFHEKVKKNSNDLHLDDSSFERRDMFDERGNRFQIAIWSSIKGKPSFVANPQECFGNISCDIIYTYSYKESVHAFVIQAKQFLSRTQIYRFDGLSKSR